MNNEEIVLKLIEDNLYKTCKGLECNVVKNNIDLRLENIQLKKQIDLIIDEFYKKAKISTKCYLQKSIEECMKYKNCKECLKKYFTNKVNSKIQ